MIRVRVFIATTEGPVAVQKITAEDPDVPSVACRDGTTEVLAISRDYTRFVDRGTGLVAALTGHAAYRLDLDRPVDGGRSWHLPVLLAHLLEAEGRLAGPMEPADLVLLATGEVDREQRVRPVGRIGEKIAAAADLIARHGDDGPPLCVLIPAADRGPGIGERLADAGAPGRVKLVAWERVGDTAALHIEATGGTVPDPEPRTGDANGTDDALRRSRQVARSPRNAGRSEADREPAATASARASPGAPRPPGKRLAGLLLFGLAAIGAGLGAAWWDGPRHWDRLRSEGDYEALGRSLQHALLPPLAERYRAGLLEAAPPPDKLVFSLVERRSADGRPCRGGRFGGTNEASPSEFAETSLAPVKPAFFQSERAASLCQAVYRVANEGDRLVYLYFAARPALSVATGGTAGTPRRRAAAVPSGASLAIDLDFRPHPDTILGVDLVVLAAPSPSPQIRRAFEAATEGDGRSMERAPDSLDLGALPALGLTVKGASHAILR